MGRLASGPGADGAVALTQVACSIYQGYTFRFPGYISKGNVLLVSESVASKQISQRGNTSLWTFDLGAKGIIFTIHMPKNVFLGCIELRKSTSAQLTFPSSYSSEFNPK
jgi:hypothetical protein